MQQYLHTHSMHGVANHIQNKLNTPVGLVAADAAGYSHAYSEYSCNHADLGRIAPLGSALSIMQRR